MAKMIRSKADENIILSAIGSTEDYSKFKSSQRQIVIVELLKTTNNFCPFTGDWFPKARNWTIEHFYYPKSVNRDKEMDWKYWIHCVSDGNKNFSKNSYDHTNVYSPEVVDYCDVLEYVEFTGYIRPKNTDDAKALNTINRFKLNHPLLVKCRKSWFDDKEKYENEPFPFCEYF
jgi:hypothetical protein